VDVNRRCPLWFLKQSVGGPRGWLSEIAREDIVNAGGGYRRLACGYCDLMKVGYNIAGGIRSFDRRLHMLVHHKASHVRLLRPEVCCEFRSHSAPRLG
jgi:hypothetical protein